MTSSFESEKFNADASHSEPQGHVNDSFAHIAQRQSCHPAHEDEFSSGTRLLRLPDVLRMFPVSRSTWYAGIDDEIYPKPIRLSARVVAWRERDILNLIRKIDQ